MKYYVMNRHIIQSMLESLGVHSEVKDCNQLLIHILLLSVLALIQYLMYKSI